MTNYLKEIFSQYPEGKRKPVVGITANHQDIDVTLRDRYCQQIVAAGGVPLLIPPVSDSDTIIETLERIDALLLSGGADHHPRYYNEKPSPLLGNVNDVRDLPELLICRLASNRQMPILGICRGIQTMAIALGGHVAQDISLRRKAVMPVEVESSLNSTAINHSQTEDRNITTHSVRIARNSTLYNIYAREEIMVNSFHHQAVDDSGAQFRPIAWSADGVIEAIESNEEKPMVGVQWHPEWLEAEGLSLFKWLVSEAELFRKAKALHSRILTIDSHCDTPMFFSQGADFSKRDDRILVDLHKMTDGRQDVTTMVAYVPQPTDNPKLYADRIFDRIEQIVDSKPEHLAIARTEEELWCNKAAGRKSIMLGIENALAIETLADAEHFARRGAVYFTLCHNGDNQVCDSARRSKNTWGGVSKFGELLIAEMNRLGVTIDLSHAGERSFFDALAISRQPVVCSHSNCRALCDHERNLSDEQLRALANKGGVCQITLYEGFVSQNLSEADILRAIEHLNHAVKIMGVEHVGLGTDFDGDGGLRGLRNSSEMILFTRQLLLNHYSSADIEKIWGGNWIRVALKHQ